jgi:hypothetical protein
MHHAKPLKAWENVWGVYNQITPRDGEAVRRVAHILRYFGRGGFTQSMQWEPHTRTVVQAAVVFGSMWPVGEETMWTLVNRGTLSR